MRRGHAMVAGLQESCFGAVLQTDHAVESLQRWRVRGRAAALSRDKAARYAGVMGINVRNRLGVTD